MQTLAYDSQLYDSNNQTLSNVVQGFIDIYFFITEK